MKDQVVGQTKQAMQQARDRAGSSLAESKGQLAEQVGSIARAFRRTTEQLRGEDRTTIASLTDALAGQADRVAEYLRQVDARAIQQDLEDLARRRPAVVLGGAFALSVVAARFLKSSERGRREPQYRKGGLGRPLHEPRRPAIEAPPIAGEPGPGLPAGGPAYSPSGPGYPPPGPRPAYPPPGPGMGPGGP